MFKLVLLDGAWPPESCGLAVLEWLDPEPSHAPAADPAPAPAPDPDPNPVSESMPDPIPDGTAGFPSFPSWPSSLVDVLVLPAGEPSQFSISGEDRASTEVEAIFSTRIPLVGFV